MVKKKTGASRQRVKAERRAKDVAASKEFDEREPLVTRRLQQKIAKRVRFLEKVAASRPSNALGLKQAGTKKKRRRQASAGRLADLSTLSASLAEAAHEDSEKAAAKSTLGSKGLGAGGAKKRLHIVAQETQRLQQVLSHPQYKANPIGAVTNHLAAALPPAPAAAKAKPDPALRKQQKARRKWEKKLQCSC